MGAQGGNLALDVESIQPSKYLNRRTDKRTARTHFVSADNSETSSPSISGMQAVELSQLCRVQLLGGESQKLRRQAKTTQRNAKIRTKERRREGRKWKER